jgi:hypothetical protein
MSVHALHRANWSGARHDDGRAFGYPVVLAGALGGVTFLLFKMAAAALLGGSAATPLRLIGAIVLGEDALRADSSLAAAAAAALGLHLVLSVVYSLVFLVVARRVQVLCRSRLTVLLAASGMGLLLWVVNLRLIAPVFFPWFMGTRPSVEITARVLCFGLPVGLVLSRTILSRGDTSGTALPEPYSLASP